MLTCTHAHMLTCTHAHMHACFAQVVGLHRCVRANYPQPRDWHIKDREWHALAAYLSDENAAVLDYTSIKQDAENEGAAVQGGANSVGVGGDGNGASDARTSVTTSLTSRRMAIDAMVKFGRGIVEAVPAPSSSKGNSKQKKGSEDAGSISWPAVMVVDGVSCVGKTACVCKAMSTLAATFVGHKCVLAHVMANGMTLLQVPCVCNLFMPQSAARVCMC
jgi:hypothetical protein